MRKALAIFCATFAILSFAVIIGCALLAGYATHLSRDATTHTTDSVSALMTTEDEQALLARDSSQLWRIQNFQVQATGAQTPLRRSRNDA